MLKIEYKRGGVLHVDLDLFFSTSKKYVAKLKDLIKQSDNPERYIQEIQNWFDNMQQDLESYEKTCNLELSCHLDQQTMNKSGSEKHRREAAAAKFYEKEIICVRRLSEKLKKNYADLLDEEKKK